MNSSVECEPFNMGRPYSNYIHICVLSITKADVVSLNRVTKPPRKGLIAVTRQVTSMAISVAQLIAAFGEEDCLGTSFILLRGTPFALLNNIHALWGLYIVVYKSDRVCLSSLPSFVLVCDPRNTTKAVFPSRGAAQSGQSYVVIPLLLQGYPLI